MHEQIETAKVAFLAKFNPERTMDKALRSGVTAAVQHNDLYAEGIDQVIREKVRVRWKTELMRIYELNLKTADYADYEVEIVNLKNIMNSALSHCFIQNVRPNRGIEPGFRISHAQKSIAVFLKHVWCMNLIETPAQCPVDRIILNRAGYVGYNPPWTRVNSIEEHRNQIRLLTQKSKQGGMPSLAVWELLNY